MKEARKQEVQGGERTLEGERTKSRNVEGKQPRV